MRTFSDFGIFIPCNTNGEVRTTCPRCSESRRKSRDACLAVNADTGAWLCHHCGWKGGLHGRLSAVALPPTPRPPVPPDDHSRGGRTSPTTART